MEFADKAGILGQLWIDFRDDNNFSAFMEYNDIGVPMAYYVAEGLVTGLTPLGEQYVEESIDMMFKLLEITEAEVDELHEINLTTVLDLAYEKKNPGSSLEQSLLGLRPEGAPRKSYQIGHMGQTIFSKDHYEPSKIFPQTQGITKDKFFSPNLGLYHIKPCLSNLNIKVYNRGMPRHFANMYKQTSHRHDSISDYDQFSKDMGALTGMLYSIVTFKAFFPSRPKKDASDYENKITNA